MLGDASPSDWFPLAAPDPRAALSLFCFPHAGAGASTFFRWTTGRGEPVDVVPESIDHEPIDVVPVQLPGREERRDAPFRRLVPLSDALADMLEPHLDRPFALFGHSLGAWVIFELSRRLRERGRPAPEHLFVSAAAAPQRPRRHEPLCELDDEAFLAALEARYGVAAPALEEYRELIAARLPVLRADVELVETYEYREEPPLACPISVLGGRDDRSVSTAELADWRAQTSADFSQRQFAGDHFYLETVRDDVLRLVASRLAPTLKRIQEGG